MPDTGLTNIPGASITTPFVGVSGVSPYVVSNLWSVVLPDGATAFQLGNPGAGYASIFATNLIITPDGLHYTLFTDGTNSFFGGDLYLTNSTFHGKSFRPTKVAMTIVGATAQSTNLMEIQGGTSNILAYVDKDGVFSGNGAGLTNLTGATGFPAAITNNDNRSGGVALNTNLTLSSGTLTVARESISQEFRPSPRTNKTCVSFTFDDGLTEVGTLMFPMFTNQGVPGVANVIGTKIGTPGYMGWDTLTNLQLNGWEVCPHGSNHVAMGSSDEAQLRAELNYCVTNMQQHGFPARNLVTPSGSPNTMVQEVAREYFRSIRGGDVAINARILNTYNLTITNADDHTKLTNYEAAVDAAVTSNAWVIFLYDQGAPDANDVTTCSNLINYVKSLGLEIVTLDQGLDRMGNANDLAGATVVHRQGLRAGRIMVGDVQDSGSRVHITESKLSAMPNTSPAPILGLETSGKNNILAFHSDAGYQSIIRFDDLGNSGMGYINFANSDHSLRLAAVGGEQVSIVNTNVGIGTTTPHYKLDVNGMLSVSNATYIAGAFTVTGPNGGIQLDSRSGSGASPVFYNPSGAGLRIYNGGDQISLLNNGYLGVGIVAPLAILHVKGGDGLLGELSTSRTGAGNIWLKFSDNADAARGLIGFDPSTTGFEVNANGSSLALNATGGGNVGVGTASPAAKLDVAGAIHSGVTNTTTPALVSLGTNNAVLRCPDGGSWILRVGNDGTLSTVTNSAGL